MAKKEETIKIEEDKIEKIELVDNIPQGIQPIENVEIVPSKENNIDDVPKDVNFDNHKKELDEVEKVPDYFVSPPRNNKEVLFGVKNGRTYKRIDNYTGVYTDTGEAFDLRK